MRHSWQNWFIWILYVILVVDTFRRIDAASHSVSDALIGFALPFVGLSVLVYLATRSH